MNGRRDRGILLPLLSSDVLAVTDLVRTASALASTAGTDLSVINPITVPEQTPPSYGPRVSDHEDEGLLEWPLAEARTATVVHQYPARESTRLFSRGAQSFAMRFTRSKEETDDATTGRRADAESASWFDRAKAKYGLAGLLIALGAVLFVIPEPLTSTAGVALMVIGGVLWLASYFR